MAGFKKGHDEIEFGDDIKLRSNGSRKLPQAIPNPYSNSELPVLLLVLSQSKSNVYYRTGIGCYSSIAGTYWQQNDESDQFKHHKRVVQQHAHSLYQTQADGVCWSRYMYNNYIILSSTIIQYIIAGEFGVVYKAQYTEPEGDIGYKTSTVAVKTLKGTMYIYFI